MTGEIRRRPGAIVGRAEVQKLIPKRDESDQVCKSKENRSLNQLLTMSMSHLSLK